MHTKETEKQLQESELAKIVVNAGLRIHKTLGPGLLESAYEECLFHELTKAGLNVEKQKPLPLVYENMILDTGYYIDLLIENKLVVMIKSVDVLTDLHMAQILTYLKLSNCKFGILINFNTVLFKDGIRKAVNKDSEQ